MLNFVLLAFHFISPLLFPAIYTIVGRPLGAPFADRARILALSVFAVSTATMIVLSMFVEVFFYWNIIGVLLLMPLLAGWFDRVWVYRLHLGYGLCVALFTLVNFSIVPIGNLVGRYDWTVSSAWGWTEVAARIETLEQQHEVGFVAATRYTTAAQLGYAMHDPEIVAIADRHDQYDYWFNPAEHEGQSALVVSDPVLGTRYVSRFFDTFKLIDTVRFERFGQVIYRARIYLATGFHAEPKR